MVTDVVAGTAALGFGGLVIAALLGWARTRFPVKENVVVDQINQLLPQTQCAQCGYPGCRPYAEAIASGVAINRCPPGGEATIAALAQLLGRDVIEADPACGKPGVMQVAAIREGECIGCTLCIAACPIDAIFGAPQLMHTVIEAECTGCELCLPPCPVDCIDLVSLSQREDAASINAVSGSGSGSKTELDCDTDSISDIESDPESECIRCGLCEEACPRDLAPQDLYWYQQDETTLGALQLDACIECRRCDRVCPANLPLTQIFRTSKVTIRARAETAARAAYTEARYEAHVVRIAEPVQQVRRRSSASERAALLAALQQRKP